MNYTQKSITTWIKRSAAILTVLVTVMAPLSATAAEGTWVLGRIFFDFPSQSINRPSLTDRNEILWLARVIHSESKRAREQHLVAWVVRNRVESAYRGKTSYKAVALDRNQFSGLNKYDAQYKLNISRGYDSEGTAWKSALAIAEDVYSANEIRNPLPKSVKHFYSPMAVKNTPSWATDKAPFIALTDSKTGAKRFAFYSGVK